MQYIEIRPDFVESGIKNEFNGDYIEIDELPFNQDIRNKIKSLNEKYKKVIPMGKKMRKAHLDLIYQLDKEGFSLKIEIEDKYNFKVKYFSEGHLKYLFNPPEIRVHNVKKGFYSKALRVLERFLGDK